MKVRGENKEKKQMKTLLNNKLLQVGIILLSLSILSGCNTVKGTVTGAGEDIRSVTHAVNG
jgi:predicted small secreted protein